MSLTIDNYDILCSKYRWSSNTPLYQVNFFSGVSPQTQETIDLKEYLIDMGDLSYDFDEANKENGENQLFYISSDISFELSGLVNRDKLKTFFGFFEDTDYTKWKIQIVRRDGLTSTIVWEGFVHHQSPELPFTKDDDSETISITAISLEKEFKEWFSSKTLPTTGIFSTVGGVNALSKKIIGLNNPGFSNETDGWQRRGTQLSRVFNNIFTGIFWSFESTINDWYLIDNPVLARKTSTYGTSENFVFVKSSIERIRTNGENCYDFVRKICNSMGWVFYYQGGQFKVKNRGTDIPTITNLDVNKILDYTVSKYKETNTFPHILILDGTIDGGDGTGGNVGGIEEEYRPYQMRGARFQLISDIANPERIGKGIWWKSIVEGLTNFVYLNANDKFVRYFNEDENTFRIAFHTRTNAPVIPPFSGWSISYSGVTQNDMLRIDVGDTGTSMWLYDVTNGDNNPHSSDASTPAPINQWTHNRIRFKGNYGNSLVKLSSAGFNVYNITNTYQDYVKTNTFFNNFVKFFDSRLTRKITVKYNEIIDNPIQVFRFINDTENHLTGTWIINSMKINFQDETTELELQRKFETVRDPNIIEDIIEIDTEVDNDLGSEEEVEI